MIGRRALLPLAAALLAFPAVPAAARPVTPDPEVAALRGEIAALQVDRALSLSPEQARALLPVLRKAAAEVQSFRDRMAAPDPALVAALTRARDELRAGGAVTPATQDAIRQAFRARWKGDRGEARALRDQAFAILTPAQVASLRSVRLGVGAGPAPGAGPDDGAPGAGPGRGPGRGMGRRLLLLGVLTSDPFLALVEARAR